MIVLNISFLTPSFPPSLLSFEDIQQPRAFLIWFHNQVLELQPNHDYCPTHHHRQIRRSLVLWEQDISRKCFTHPSIYKFITFFFQINCTFIFLFPSPPPTHTKTHKKYSMHSLPSVPSEWSSRTECFMFAFLHALSNHKN